MTRALQQTAMIALLMYAHGTTASAITQRARPEIAGDDLREVAEMNLVTAEDDDELRSGEWLVTET